MAQPVSPPELSVVVPVFKEGESIVPVMRALTAAPMSAAPLSEYAVTDGALLSDSGTSCPA